MKLGLVFIVGTNNKELVAMLDSTRGADFDEISAVMTRDSREVERTLTYYGCKVTKIEGFWKDDYSNWDFSAARNLALDNCDTDVVMFLDTDDILVNPKNVRPLVEKHLSDNDCLLVNYDYEQDENGNSVNTYLRERVFIKDKFRWVGAVHEYPKSLTEVKYFEVPSKKLLVKHNIDKDVKRSDRNLTISKRVVKENKTPRGVYYLARDYMFSGDLKNAQKCLKEFIKMKGSIEEKYCALMYLYKMTDKVDEMKRYAEEAMNLNPSWSEAYFKIAFVQLLKADYTNCIANSKMGFDLEKPVPGQPYNRLEFTLMPTRVMHAALEALGEQESADKVAEYALAEFPDDEYLNSKLVKEKV